MEVKGKEGEGRPGKDQRGKGEDEEKDNKRKIIIREAEIYRDGETKSLHPGRGGLTHRAYLALRALGLIPDHSCLLASMTFLFQLIPAPGPWQFFRFHG